MLEREHTLGVCGEAPQWCPEMPWSGVGVHINILAYADDAALLAPSWTAMQELYLEL
jgi:hypothetical protein